MISPLRDLCYVLIIGGIIIVALLLVDVISKLKGIEDAVHAINATLSEWELIEYEDTSQ